VVVDLIVGAALIYEFPVTGWRPKPDWIFPTPPSLETLYGEKSAGGGRIPSHARVESYPERYEEAGVNHPHSPFGPPGSSFSGEDLFSPPPGGFLELSHSNPIGLVQSSNCVFCFYISPASSVQKIAHSISFFADMAPSFLQLHRKFLLLLSGLASLRR